MASRYAKPIAVDKNGNSLTDDSLPLKALVTSLSENATTSSVITLNDNTTDLEIAAVTAPVFIRWVPRSETAAVSPFASVISSVGGQANFDFVVPAGWVRKFVVPVEQMGTSSTVGANIANGLYNRVAWKTGGIGSILATQY